MNSKRKKRQSKMEDDAPLNTEPKEANDLHRPRNITIDMLRQKGLSITLDNYLAFAHLGEETLEIGPEEFACLPAHLQRAWRRRHG